MAAANLCSWQNKEEKLECTYVRTYVVCEKRSGSSPLFKDFESHSTRSTRVTTEAGVVGGDEVGHYYWL